MINLGVTMLEGRRVYLRLLEKEDLPYRVKWINDEEISKNVSFDWPVSLAKTQTWFQNSLMDKSKVNFSIIDKKSNKLIGMTGLVNINYIHSRGEFYITIGEKDFWGKHLPDEIIPLVLEYGFIELGLNRIYLSTFDHNKRAQKVYKRNGFVYEGRLRNHQFHKGAFRDYLIYSILKEEWTKKG